MPRRERNDRERPRRSRSKDRGRGREERVVPEGDREGGCCSEDSLFGFWCTDLITVKTDVEVGGHFFLPD